MHPDIESILSHFSYGHHPPSLQSLFEPFCELAIRIANEVPAKPEGVAALRKLLVARAHVERAIKATW